MQYEVCMACYRKSGSRATGARAAPASATYRWYKPEYSPAWDKEDATAKHFFVYLLKLDGGKFYAGQTRELRERLSEHRDGKVQSTAGRHPKLTWFGIVPTRETAAALEVELKKLIDSNEREIRRMVISFRDLVRELQYD